MTKGVWLTLMIAVVATRAGVSAQEADAEDTGGEQSAKRQQVPLPILEQQNREKFLFGSYSTTTYTNYVLTTSTVFYSCLVQSASQSVCIGRNRPSSKRMIRDAPHLKSVKKLAEDDKAIT
ncbi:hypothetical protein SK128_016682, partial [Halocaridina rubra]